MPVQISREQTSGVSVNVIEAHDVLLRDGRTLRLRPPRTADIDAVLEFFSRLSERSFYQRFHGAPPIGPRLAEPFVDPDWDDRGVYAGVVAGTEGEERIVALASYIRLRDATTAEAAFAVADELQGHGVGTRLLEQLAARARAVGIERFVAEVMPDNSAMVRVFEEAGFDVERELEGGTLEVRFEIGSTERYLASVDERDHVAAVRSYGRSSRLPRSQSSVRPPDGGRSAASSSGTFFVRTSQASRIQ